MCKKGNWFSNIVRDKNGGLKKEYILPITVESDSDYKTKLKKLMTDLCVVLKRHKETVKYAKIVSQYDDFFSRILNAQYAGDLVLAQEIACKIIEDLKADDDLVAFSPINKSIAFRNMQYVLTDDADAPEDNERKVPVSLYRARTSETYTKYTRLEMLHVPFNKRQFVSNARFSISGFPCLYLGSSSYCCWLELGTPEPQHFNVSSVEVNEDKEILNLTMNAYDFEQCVELKVNEKKTITAFKLWLLCIATSFIVNEKGRIFKSEYVIPQMIMLVCKKAGYYGVSYYSKRVENDFIASFVCVNLAVFASYNGEAKVSGICADIELTDSMNFEMFKNLMPSLKYKKPLLNVDNSIQRASIGDFERQYPYNETEFYDFDKFLMASLKKERKKVNVDAVNKGL